MNNSQERKCYFDAFRQILKAVASTLSLEEVLKLLVNNVTDVLQLKGCAIRLLHPSRRTLELVASNGLSDSYIKKGPVDADSSIATSLDGQIVTIFDATRDERLQYPQAAREEGIASLVSIPMTLRGRVIGVMRIYTSEQRIFSEEDLAFAEGLAEMGAIAIQNARVHEGLKKDFDRTVELYIAEMNQ